MVLLVAAVGRSGSGKTTTIEYLISKLTAEGINVGAVKHVHHKGFTMDTEGKNTWRFAKAGAKTIVAVSPDEVAIIRKTTVEYNDFEKIIALLAQEKLDVVFVEGLHSLTGKRRDIVKIVTATDINGLSETLKGTIEPIIAVSGVVTKTLGTPNYKGIPAFKIPEEGEKLLELLKKRLDKKATE
jgi:molybdopterin-guanine dinucleotide biosynthesis adapter protein